MHKVSAVVLAKNEEQVLSRCLSSLSWCDELLTIDDGSIDKTTHIAKRFGAKVYKHPLQNNFAQQRNYGLQKAKHNWVLFVDADEVVSNILAKKIQDTMHNPQFSSYGMQRTNIFIGKKLHFREYADDRLVRLVKKGTGKWRRKVHEYWDSDQSAGELKGELFHYSIESITDLVEKLRVFSLLHSQEIKREQKNVHFYKVLLYPPIKFLKKYILENGYKDSVRGFIMCVGMSFHSFLSWSQLCLEKRS